jgi:hypothetical protein
MANTPLGCAIRQLIEVEMKDLSHCSEVERPFDLLN